MEVRRKYSEPLVHYASWAAWMHALMPAAPLLRQTRF